VRSLLLLRHAKTEAGSGVDVTRALTTAGRDQAYRVAEHVTVRLPELVLCSSAVRAQQTWQRLAAGLDDLGAVTADLEVAVLDSLYEASPRTVLEAVRERAGEARTVLVIGHEPIMSMTAAALAGPGSDDAGTHVVAAGLPTASLAVLQTDSPWSELTRAGARLTQVLHTSV